MLTGRKVASRTQETFTWNDNGELTQTRLISPTSLTSPAALEDSNYQYTPMGNLDSADLPGPSPSARRYYSLNYKTDGTVTLPEKLGQPLVVTDPLGHKTHYRYNERGLVTDVWDDLNLKTSYIYNIADQVTDVYAPASSAGQRTRLSYNYLYPGGPMMWQALYSEAGIQLRRVDFAHGAEGELLRVIGDTPNLSTVEYDPLYQISRFKDGNGNATNYTYDKKLGYLTRIDYPGGNYATFSNFDPLGRYLQKTDSRGQSIIYVYEGGWGQLSEIRYPASSIFYPGYNITPNNVVYLLYDSMTRLCQVDNSWAFIEYRYNDADMLTLTETTLATWFRRIKYQYNPDGSRATMQIPISAGNGIFSYYYDAAGRPTRVVNPFGEGTDYAYEANDRLVNKVTSYGVEVASTDFTNDYRSRVTSLQNRRLSNILARFSGPQGAIEFDGAGNRTQVSIDSNSNFFGFNFTGRRQYVYNPIGTGRQTGQVTGETFLPPTGSNYIYYNGFNYDDAGNLLDFSTSKGITRNGKVYNASNQPTDLPFDNNGNQTQRDQPGIRPITYDWEDNATQFNGPDLSNPLQSGYLQDGRRIWRQSGGNSSSLRYYIYDGMQPVVEVDGGGAVTAVNTFGADGLVSRSTGTFALGGTAPTAQAQGNAAAATTDGSETGDSPKATPPGLPRDTSSGPLIPLANGSNAAAVDSYYPVFYLFDERGNTSLRLDRSGNILSAHVTDAYGTTLTRDYNGSSANDPYAGMGAQFGYEKEPMLELYRCGLRHYDPTTGRWLTRDPIGYDGGANLYGYVSGNPVMGVDPEGTDIIIMTPGASAKESRDFADQINAALAILRKTKHGQYMLSQVDGTIKNGRDLRIYRFTNLGNNYGKKHKNGCGYVKIDLDALSVTQPQFRSDKTGQLFFDYSPLWRTLAHELGHAVEGDPDQSPVNRSNWDWNIGLNENPVARELGAPMRVNYNKVRFIKKR